MIRVFLAAFIWLLPAMALAQTVKVRSGEHADFARLAFDFSTPIEWQMGRVKDGYKIRLTGHDADIDISSVYNRISRDRIKNISISDDGHEILLSLDCQCHADAFEFRPGFLVIDIKDGLPTRTAGFEAAFKPDEISPPPAQAILDSPPARIRVEKSATKPVVLPTITTQNGHSIFRNSLPLNEGVEATGLEDDDDEGKQQIANMQSEMLLQIGRAASQGLLSATAAPTIKPAKPIEDHRDDPTVSPAPPPTPERPHINIHIESSVDREFSQFLSILTTSGAENKCLADDMLNIADWGDADSIWHHITEQRGNITGEFDRSNAQAVEKLAKAYIYAGFGAEAQKVITGFGVNLKNAEYLLALSMIVDGNNLPSPNILSGQLGCNSSAAFWAVMGSAELSPKTQINRKTILRTFSSSPLHLRRHLGPRLAQKFLDLGDLETAQSIQNAISRATGNGGSELTMLKARMQQEHGLHSEAVETLGAIISRGERASPSALIELIEAKLENGDHISNDLLASVESYIFEQPNTEIGANLKRVTALAHGKSGDLKSALKAIRELQNTASFDTKTMANIWSDVLKFGISSATNDTFLRFIYDAQHELSKQNIPKYIRRNAANLLLESGLPKMAEQLLGASSSPEVEDRIILARAAIMVGQPYRVAQILDLITGPLAAKIRGDAYAALGEHSNAAQEYAIAEDGNLQNIATWRAKNWEKLANVGSAAMKFAADIMMREAQRVATDNNVTIANGRAIIVASEAVRGSINLLLKEFPTPVQGGS